METLKLRLKSDVYFRFLRLISKLDRSDFELTKEDNHFEESEDSENRKKRAPFFSIKELIIIGNRL